MGQILNYSDFYCGECKYFVELWDNRKNEARFWCDKHNKRIKEQDPGCRLFQIGVEEGDQE